MDLRRLTSPQLLDYYSSLKMRDVIVGDATVVCISTNQWALPGGRTVYTEREAEKAAKNIDCLMKGLN